MSQYVVLYWFKRNRGWHKAKDVCERIMAETSLSKTAIKRAITKLVIWEDLLRERDYDEINGYKYCYNDKKYC